MFSHRTNHPTLSIYHLGEVEILKPENLFTYFLFDPNWGAKQARNTRGVTNQIYK
jgi:hypothetical protein